MTPKGTEGVAAPASPLLAPRSPLAMLAVPTVEKLELETMPKGVISRFWLAVSENGLGNPISVPVLVARGARPGPVFGITAAVHGDELNGIPVIHQLLDRLDLSTLRGTIVAVPVVNVPGFLRKIRYFPNGTDPNHVFPGKIGGNLADAYVARLCERLVPHFEYLIDLHTARRGNVNSLYIRADLSQGTANTMARLFSPQIILDDPPSDHTLRGHAAEAGIPAITVEIGDPARFQPAYIKRTLNGLRAVLAEVGLLPRRKARAPESEPVICSKSRWMFTDGGGLLDVLPEVTRMVEPGQVVARLTNVFGDLCREYRAAERGIVIGRSVEPHADMGARILHLGTLAAGTQGPLPVPHLSEG